MRAFFLHTCLVATFFSYSLMAAENGTKATTAPVTSTSASVAQPAGENPIQDNSFLVEEAYNQEDGVIQHISFVQPSSTGDWIYTQTDEWPVRSLKHQVSLTLGFNHAAAYPGSGPGWGDTAINYRYQLVGSGETKLAVAPRVSLLLPTANSGKGRGYGGWGLQTNLPVSIQHNRYLVTHWNAGVTLIPSAQDSLGHHAAAINYNLAESTVWLVKARFNALCEIVWTSNAAVDGPQRVSRAQSLYVSPGVRWAYNFPNGLQIVPGVGFPIGFMSVREQKDVILYLSFEHGFQPAHSRRRLRKRSFVYRCDNLASWISSRSLASSLISNPLLAMRLLLVRRLLAN